MIAREWKCKCPNTNKENFIEYLYKTGVHEASKTSGYLGVQIFSRDFQGKSEITLITFWDNIESIKTFYPVTIDRWNDFEQLFECKGGPHNCWCTVWRVNEYKKTIPGKNGKKASVHNRVKKGIPIGILAYHENNPIGWCSIAPRETYKKLGGDDSKEEVWSLVCFFIKRQFRNKGLTSRLIDAAMRYTKDNGAKYIEAYPVASDSPSYRFMGFVPTFEKVGFQFVKSAGTRRNVMIFALK